MVSWLGVIVAPPAAECDMVRRLCRVSVAVADVEDDERAGADELEAHGKDLCLM